MPSVKAFSLAKFSVVTLASTVNFVPTVRRPAPMSLDAFPIASTSLKVARFTVLEASVVWPAPKLTISYSWPALKAVVVALTSA